MYLIKTFGQAIAFLLSPSQVIEKLSWVFERFDHLFRNKYSVELFHQR